MEAPWTLRASFDDRIALAVGCRVGCALDLAEPDGMLLSFILQPAPGLLERHAGSTPPMPP